LLPLIFYYFTDTATTENYTLSLHDALPIFRARQHPVADQDHVGEEEAEKNRQQDFYGFLHAAQVQVQQQPDQHELGGELEFLGAERQQAEDRVDPARDRDRDREHVIDDQRRPGHEPGVGADQAGRDLVAAAARRKQLDDLI